MNGEEIIQEIKRYIKDDVYNYAVLIDGEWGSGKTFFVQNELKKEIENEVIDEKVVDVKYISLYGCKSIEDVKENITWEFIGDLHKQKGENTSQKDTKGKKTSDYKGAGVSSIKKIVGSIAKKILPEQSIIDMAWDWLKVKSCIFIFDDLERADCSINEIFGFINSMVEHDSIKVIIVANEKEIISEIESDKIEQQYMIALDERIQWPRYKENSMVLSCGQKPTTKERVSFEELETRRSALFKPVETNLDYKRIKEKLIGITLKYEADYSKILKKLILKADYSPTVTEIVSRNTEYIEQRMDFYKHHNLRTIQFFLTKVLFILNQLKKIEADSEYVSKIEDYVVCECYRFSAEYKCNYKAPKNDVSISMSSNIEPPLRSVNEYIEKGQFNYELFKKEIDGVKSFYRANIDSQDPYQLLYNNYYYLTQNDCENHLREMIDRLKEDKYPVSLYVKMLGLVASLELMGFPSSYSDVVVDIMIENIKKSKNFQEIFVDHVFFSDEKIYKKTLEFAHRINTEVGNHENITKRRDIKEILLSNNWVNDITTFANPGNEAYIPDVPIFSLAEANDWIDAIEKSTSEQIHMFRSWMWSIYPGRMIKKSFPEDWDTLESIHEGIEPSKEKDLIKKKALELVIWQIEELYKLNTGQEYNNEQTTSKHEECVTQKTIQQ